MVTGTSETTIDSSGLSAWLHEVPAPSVGPQTRQFDRSEAEVPAPTADSALLSTIKVNRYKYWYKPGYNHN
jgi:hypothetical protein